MMNCATVDVCCEDGYCIELSRATPKARKTHRCGECRKFIEPGEKYERVATLYDGEFDENKTCLDCASIRKVFFHSWMWGSVIDDMREHIAACSGIISESSIARLTPGGKEKVCGILEDYWRDYEEE